jgi:hypothetical protein
VYGDFSKTRYEIELYLKSQEKPSVDYLSYPEQKIMNEKIKQQEVRNRKKKSAKNKAKAKRKVRRYKLINTRGTLFDDNAFDEDVIMYSSAQIEFDNDDNYFIDETLNNSSVIVDETYVNPSTGMIMIGGIGGIDSGGHTWGEPDSFNDSFSDSFSSIDDSFSLLDDSSDCFSTDMDDW